MNFDALTARLPSRRLVVRVAEPAARDMAALHWHGAAVLAAAAFLMTATPGRSETFTPPSGCTLEVTVQNRGCTVSQIYRCSADPQGYQNTAIFDESGLQHISQIDAETRWIESTSPATGISDYLVEEAKDHASFSTLLKTGKDGFDFWTKSNSGEELHHVGEDILTGEKVTIDGIELEQTSFELKTTNQAGEVLIARRGNQFINRALARFFGGKETLVDETGAEHATDDSPVLFSFPGEDGFGDTTPQFDCGQMVAMSTMQRAPL